MISCRRRRRRHRHRRFLLVGCFCAALLFWEGMVDVTRTAATIKRLFDAWKSKSFSRTSSVGSSQKRRTERRASSSSSSSSSSFLVLADAAAVLSEPNNEQDEDGCDDEDDVVLIKLGGSSLTHKAVKESLNQDALDWFAKTLASTISSDFMAAHYSPATATATMVENTETCQEQSEPSKQRQKRRTSFIVVHGAGSFGHHQAKQFGLKKNGGGESSSGIQETTINSSSASNTTTTQEYHHHHHHRHQMQGLAQTRLSVQTLNRLVVSALIQENINAVGISPCFSMSSMMMNAQAEGEHDRDVNMDTSSSAAPEQLRDIVQSTLRAGLVPVLHGDACLFPSNNRRHHQDDESQGTSGGILSGDTLIEWLGTASWVSRVIFLTDVDGVFTADPRLDASAEFVPLVAAVSPSSKLDNENHQQEKDIQATGSTHAHDVTGGFRTKLASAIAVAQTGMKNVTIVKCGSKSAERVMMMRGTTGILGDDDESRNGDKESTKPQEDEELRYTVVYKPVDA